MIAGIPAVRIAGCAHPGRSEPIGRASRPVIDSTVSRKPGTMTEPTEQPDATQRRTSSWWWLACAVVVVAAVVAALALTTGHAGGGENDTAGGTTTSPPSSTTTSTASSGYDLSTPESAAESFATAAATGSGDTLLSLACVGHLSCVTEHAPDLDAASLTDARAVISENAYELADHLEGAEFAPAVDGTRPGTKDVPYRTPAMTGGTTVTLTFVQSGGEWLYLGPTT